MYASTGSSTNFGMGYTPGGARTSFAKSKSKDKERKRKLSAGKYQEEAMPQQFHKRYLIFGFCNPRSGDGLASGFLTDFPQVNIKDISLDLDESKQRVECEMRFYNVLEKQERETCLQLMSSAFMDDDYSTRKVVCIMGGDGSLARTIQFLRTSSVVDQAM